MAGNVVGDDLYLEFNSVNISTLVREFDPGREDDTVEGTAAGDVLRAHVITKTMIEPTATLVLDSTATSILAVLKPGTTGNLIWGLQGNAAGLPKGGIAARVTKGYPGASITYDDLTVLEITWINTSGAWVHDPTTAVF